MGSESYSKYVLIFAIIPLILSIGMAPVMSFGSIFGTPKKHILDTGHFALEDHLDFIAEEISSFLKSKL